MKASQSGLQAIAYRRKTYDGLTYCDSNVVQLL